MLYTSNIKLDKSNKKGGINNMTDFTWPIVSTAILAVTILVGVLVLWKNLRDKKSGFPIVDERTKKLNWKAAYYSMFLVQYFIVAYLIVKIIGGEFLGVPEFESGYPLLEALFVSGLSFLVLRWLFGRRGEP
jgi:uncharacterized Tic20 family protein